MYPTNFYKMKNFANPKTMFKSCSNNDEFSTEPVGSSCTKVSASKTSNAKNSAGGQGKQGKGKQGGNPSKGGKNKNNKAGNNTVTAKVAATTTAAGAATAPGVGGTKANLDAGAVAIPISSVPGSTRSLSCDSNTDSVATVPPSDGTVSGNVSSNENDSETAGSANLSSGSENKSVESAPHHPLTNTWTLWYLENDRSKTWEDMLHEVTSFNTVENFWSLINHIKPPSEIRLGSDYCMFKKGIRPMWEDAANKQGGRWVINLSKNTKSDLDNFWLDTMLCLIGECCDYSDQLCGAVVNIRGKSNKISVWTADGSNEVAALEIGRKLRECLRMEGVYVLQYQLHMDTMIKQGSTVKSVYTM
ncbi:eukaryotic translation initiation factor 4E1-like [Scaptodrosophila lebanonensis]|uniref:eIF-4F 25 kDa subunit n=1 Tax=Drosophila lebanonensis TaxID=7225 RepID=A0A6J2TV00_DROLE|nr:eukaryotic translation initiation factor 4E1-like [Scaptodrosophila lebanonensis]